MQTEHPEGDQRNAKRVHRRTRLRRVPNLKDLKSFTREELEQLEQNLCKVTGRVYVPVPSLPEGVSWFAAVVTKLDEDLKKAKSPYQQARIINDCHAGLFRAIDHNNKKFKEVLNLKRPYPRPKGRRVKYLAPSKFWPTMDYLWQLKNFDRSISYHHLLEIEPKKGKRDDEKGQQWWIIVGKIDFEEMGHKLNPDKTYTSNWCRKRLQQAAELGAIQEIKKTVNKKKFYVLGYWQRYQDRKTGEWNVRAVPMRWW